MTIYLTIISEKVTYNLYSHLQLLHYAAVIVIAIWALGKQLAFMTSCNVLQSCDQFVTLFTNF